MNPSQGEQPMKDVVKKLVELQAQSSEHENMLTAINKEHDDGMMDDGRWVRMKTHIGTKRAILLSEIQELLKGTELEEFNPIIEKVKNNEPEEEAKTELEKVIETKGWGETFRGKIEDYKGEIAGLITTVALGVAKGEQPMKDVIKKLVELQAKSTELEKRLTDINEEHDDGMMDNGQWVRMKTSIGTNRSVLLFEIQELLRGTELEEFNPIIEKVKNNEPEEETKIELETVVKSKGWGETFRGKIKDYKGEITGLITTVALGAAKELIGKN